MAETWLLADIGGTTTRLCLADPEGLRHDTLETRANDTAPDAMTLLARYLAARDTGVDAIAAGVAGPVRDGAAQLTNRDWHVDAKALAMSTGAVRVRLLNDLQVQGLALDDLPRSAITHLSGPAPAGDPDGPRLVLGLGTGCNIAVVHRMTGGLFVPPAEAGHSRLPHIPALAHLLTSGPAHVPVEHVLSGPGLARLHLALGAGTADTPAILAAAAARHPEALRTLEMFGLVLGHVAGDFALIHMATGGVLLIGGLARAIAPFLADTPFRETFGQKGPYAPIMRDIPVSLVTEDGAGLLGCHRALRQAPI
ncbi:glucokinase [Roseovarius sp. SCSIO 43702]|uniref:glucokinase n=1 Tax=Roseovarius sp. SCSIO 43702 TaxID=2823043 RepID=UPI001C730431|nr:glucokinase [Roseovarius sp. SCSIO 43702]QYX57340.1 glucokinase [Roseovarius sp. SCSIO 43702]